MHVEFLSDRETVTNTIVTLLEECAQAGWAVAWATDNHRVFQAATTHRKKFKALLFGTTGWHSSPDAIERMIGLETFRVLPPDRTPLFHPKIYLFRVGDETVAVIGSHNLTQSAFGRNDEACVLLRGLQTDPELQKFWRYVLAAHSAHDSTQPDAAWLFDYRQKYLRMKESRKKVEESFDTSIVLTPPTVIKGVPSPYELDWAAYVQRVVNEHERTADHDFEGRMAVLEGARKILNTGSLAALTREDRIRVSGTVHGDLTPRLNEPNWAWFGNMATSPLFRKAMRDSYQEWSDALEEIPKTGLVMEEHYRAFLNHYRSGTNPRSIASRLLAMKRPDQFVCVSDRNHDNLRDRFGLPKDISSQNYFELIKMIRLTPWWRADRPDDDLGRQVWDCRVALLDAIYYTPKSAKPVE